MNTLMRIFEWLYIQSLKLYPAEFRTKFFRFVDDVAFYLPDAEKIIHFKSASRLGYGDLGVNRERMEMLRGKFDAALSGTASPN